MYSQLHLQDAVQRLLLVISQTVAYLSFPFCT